MSAIPVGAGAIYIYTGSESAAKLTFAHNGEVTVAVGPIPDADK